MAVCEKNRTLAVKFELFPKTLVGDALCLRLQMPPPD